MVLHQVKNWKMQGCFMQFLHLIFVKKFQLQLQGTSPPDPHRGRCPWTPTGGLLRPQAPTFQLTFPFLIPMPVYSSPSKEVVYFAGVWLWKVENHQVRLATWCGQEQTRGMLCLPIVFMWVLTFCFTCFSLFILCVCVAMSQSHALKCMLVHTHAHRYTYMYHKQTKT